MRSVPANRETGYRCMVCGRGIIAHMDKIVEAVGELPRALSTDGVCGVFGEASACIWLWAWPGLLGWHTPVEWLRCSVTGNCGGPILPRMGRPRCPRGPRLSQLFGLAGRLK